MMQFFLHEIVARLVAAYLFIDGVQVLWLAIVARKLAFEQDGIMERLFSVPDWVTHRDTNPIRYWFLLAGVLPDGMPRHDDIRLVGAGRVISEEQVIEA